MASSTRTLYSQHISTTQRTTVVDASAHIHPSKVPDADLKSLFPLFDLKLARILRSTLDVPQEPCNHICEALTIAGATTWTQCICKIYEYGYIVDLEYQAQTGHRSITGRHWYDHNQYTQDVFLSFCNASNQHQELAAIQNKTTAKIPLAPFPHVTAQLNLA
eukprot:jgi/Psemu1/52850/gm1.52850_g